MYPEPPSHDFHQALQTAGYATMTTEPVKALRILIIEDDAMIAVHLGEMLEEMGHEVCGIVSTQAAAVAMAALKLPDFLIVDSWLREGSGIGAVALICTARPMPHLFVSADIAGIKAMLPNAIVIEKPFREAELEAGIRHALEQAAAA